MPSSINQETIENQDIPYDPDDPNDMFIENLRRTINVIPNEETNKFTFGNNEEPIIGKATIIFYKLTHIPEKGCGLTCNKNNSNQKEMQIWLNMLQSTTDDNVSFNDVWKMVHLNLDNGNEEYITSFLDNTGLNYYWSNEHRSLFMWFNNEMIQNNCINDE